MAYSFINTELLAAGVLLITMNRPESANALNKQMAEEMTLAIDLTKYNGDNIRAIIVTGAGEKSFCSGADLKERKDLDKEKWHEQHVAFEKLRDALLNCPLPVIAMVSGAAIGGGLELSLACDFIYASTSARFALTEATIGIMPGLGGTQLLPRAIGRRLASEMMLTGKFITAEEALRIGLINRLLQPEELLEETIATACIISRNAPLSIAAIKSAIREGEAKSIDQALLVELQYYDSLLETKDRYEGINAFNEKRKAQFIGE